MKKPFSVLAGALILFGLGACQTASESIMASPGPAPDAAHSSRTSVDWEGVYRGTVPAADAPGIDVQITLNRDETYDLRYEYQGKPGIFTDQGKFEWDRTGGIIKLGGRDWPPYYRVGENTLTQLDLEGKPITGSLAKDYVLRKQP